MEIGKVPPHDIEAEQAVLGSCLTDKDAVMDSTFLFGYKDKLYLLSWSGCVTEIDDCVAIGSGADEALGSLSTSMSEKNAEMRIIKAIKSSVLHDIYVNYPLILVDTEKGKFKIMTEESVKAIDDSKWCNYNKSRRNKLWIL